MSLGKFFKNLIGGEVRHEAPETITYKSFVVEAAPIEDPGGYRTSGFIIGEHNGEEKRVQFIRADQHSDKQQAVDHTFSKARQIIDEQGSALLTRSNL